MSDLIRRSDAIEAIENTDWWHQNRNGTMVSGANDAEHQAWYKADDVYKALEAVPSADRPQGEWKPKHNGYWTCSECGLSFLFYAKGNFCPNCGADMRKGADDE